MNYTYKFWNPCILGIGHCETVRPPKAMLQPNDPESIEQKNEKKSDEKKSTEKTSEENTSEKQSTEKAK